MEKDISWKEFFSDNARYADIINGICGRGKQIVSEHNLKEMDEDAFDVAVHYTNLTELINKKDVYEKEGNMDMCKAVRELIEDGRTEGR